MKTDDNDATRIGCCFGMAVVGADLGFVTVCETAFGSFIPLSCTLLLLVL